METKVYEYNNIKYRVSAIKDIHTRLNNDAAFAATFFQQRTTKQVTFIGSEQSEDESTPATNKDNEQSSIANETSSSTKYKWNAEMTNRLIALYKENKDKAYDPKVRKKSVFTDIAATMKAEGYDVDFNDVDRKWRNMKGSFFQILSSNKSDLTKWPYFDELYPLFMDCKQSIPAHFMSEGDKGRLGEEPTSESTPNTRTSKSKTKDVREPKKAPRKNALYRTSRLNSKLTTSDQVLLKLKMIHRHKLNLLRLQMKRNKYLKVISQEMIKSNEESKKRNELMRKFLNLYLSTCVFT